MIEPLVLKSIFAIFQELFQETPELSIALDKNEDCQKHSSLKNSPIAVQNKQKAQNLKNKFEKSSQRYGTSQDC